MNKNYTNFVTIIDIAKPRRYTKSANTEQQWADSEILDDWRYIS